MNQRTVYLCQLKIKTPHGPLAWGGIFLNSPSNDDIKLALRDAIAEESRLSQLAPSELKAKLGERVVDEAGLTRKEVTEAMQAHIQALAWVCQQTDISATVTPSVMFENE